MYWLWTDHVLIRPAAAAKAGSLLKALGAQATDFVGLVLRPTLACWLPARRATKVDPLIALPSHRASRIDPLVTRRADW